LHSGFVNLRTAPVPAGGGQQCLAAVACLTLLSPGIALAQGKPDTSRLAVQPIEIRAEPIRSFDKEGPGRTRYGRLEWRGGLVLSSPSDNFGGWSGLAFDADGNSLMAISDAGIWMTAKLTYQGLRPKGLISARIGPLKARHGRILPRPRDRDAEAIVLADGTFADGSLLIAFEKHNRIERFPIAKGEPAAPTAQLKLPAEVLRMASDGFEALTILGGGSFKGAVVALAELPIAGQKNRTGWIWIGGVPKRFTLADIDGFEITDAAGLADGGLLVLERRFRWSEGVRMRLRLVGASELKPGAVVRGDVLLEADMSREIDNMEGLAVRERPGGETLITMISDDNFNKLLQRTVLLEFALPPARKSKTSEQAKGASPVVREP
jgi:hypothetical protein